jgi:hypothetical protein
MNLIYWPPKIPALAETWKQTFGGEIFWPWFTLIGAVVTLTVAALVARVSPQREVGDRGPAA